MKNYDVIVIGGGISGIMLAYRLSFENKKILLIEKGKHLARRSCPIVTKKVPNCIKCKPCAIMQGMGGAGAFSDGKYVIGTEYGGWLPDILPHETVMRYIEEADGILVNFGATKERFMPDMELKKLCLQNDLHMQQAQLKHLGTDENFDTMKKLVDDLNTRIEIMTETTVTDVDKSAHTVTYESAEGGGTATAEKIVFAVGRAGSGFFSKWCRDNKIATENNQVDIGVRVELPYLVWQNFSSKIYEPKIWHRSKQYGDITRMFCFNERGSVVAENTEGVLTVNGHAYRAQAKKTNNSNFALLNTTRFTSPFNEPIEYARDVASLANKISGGSVLVQRLGDLRQGRRTNESRLNQSTTVPTLKAVPGDLSLCLPKRQLDNILEALEALDKVSPGTNNHDTLLYGVECKYYSIRPKCNDFEIDGLKNIFAIGDGAGFTRSLSQAAANGLYLADNMLKGR